MSPAHKTTGIFVAAGLVVAVAALLTRAPAAPRRPDTPIAKPGPTEKVQGVTVAAHMASSHVAVGASETHMALTVTAPEDTDAAPRPPLNLAIVIDRSGSMSGDKIESAREAAKQLVTRLDQADRVSIVAYGSDVEMVFPSAHADAAAKQRAVAAIDRIYDDGGTNLSGGLVAGRDEILPYRGDDRVTRVVLISDGRANEGISTRDGLADLARATAERGASITTIGVGADFDERTMTAIAVSGTGSYYYAENADMLASIFDEELTKVGATMATEIALSLSPADGVEILEAYGYDVQREGRRTIVQIADLHAGETRKVVLRLRVTASAPGGVDIADIALGYRDVAAGQMRRVAISKRAEATRSEAVVLANRDKEAYRHIERAVTAKAIDEATVAYERGDVAQAQGILSRRKADNRALAADLGDADIATGVGSAIGGASAAMQAAPAASTEGKKASKKNLKQAYDLMY